MFLNNQLHASITHKETNQVKVILAWVIRKKYLVNHNNSTLYIIRFFISRHLAKRSNIYKKTRSAKFYFSFLCLTTFIKLSQEITDFCTFRFNQCYPEISLGLLILCSGISQYIFYIFLSDKGPITLKTLGLVFNSWIGEA